MTDFDNKLIEKAWTISRWHYWEIDVLIHIADTPECRVELEHIKYTLKDSRDESL